MIRPQYTDKIEGKMIAFYNSLSEKDRRRYAAIEATKLGYGGDTYISSILLCDDRTITRGKQELEDGLSEEESHIRKPGAGRKPILGAKKEIDDVFLEILTNNTAGSPMDETIKWTNLSLSSIVEKLKEQGFTVSHRIVSQLLRKHDFRPRQAHKVEAGKTNIPHRDEQFKNIERIKQEYIDNGNPVMSMDVKKKS